MIIALVRDHPAYLFALSSCRGKALSPKPVALQQLPGSAFRFWHMGNPQSMFDYSNPVLCPVCDSNESAFLPKKPREIFLGVTAQCRAKDLCPQHFQSVLYTTPIPSELFSSVVIAPNLSSHKVGIVHWEPTRISVITTPLDKILMSTNLL